MKHSKLAWGFCSGPVVVLWTGLLVGCAGGPDAQLTSCQQDKEQLLTTIREQRDANRALRDHVASLETRLDQSEKELASLSKAGVRVSSRPAEKSQLPGRLVEQPVKPTP